MNCEKEENQKSNSTKKIKVNSIKDPLVKRILKPCEARAGHGAIFAIVGMAIIGGAIALLAKGAQLLWRWIVE